MKVHISQAVADKLEELKKLPYYANQIDTEGAIISAHADPNSSWGKGNPLNDENVTVGMVARALLIGYEIKNY